VESRPFPGEKKRPSSSKREENNFDRPVKRNRIESESEEDYDSEMDDFIDDTDAKIDISAEIRGIFGYDRRKFANERDFDDRSMENNRYSSIMKEECHSAKMGRLEDLEDMKREEEEKKRKKMKNRRR